MDGSSDWQRRFQREMDQAQTARADGNEGKARVCSRRAAGIVIAEYLERQNIPQPGPSAYDCIRCLAEMEGLSPEAYEITSHLLLRINPDRRLPQEVDLIAEVFRLKGILLGS